MIEKILVPVDSIKWDNTLSGIINAMDFARGCYLGVEEPELVFLHVLHSDNRVPMSERSRIHEMKRNKVQEEFEKIRKMCKERGIENITTKIKEGKPDVEIVKTVQQEGVDLIVIGSGRLHDKSTKGKLQKFLYGSVTENVIHEAPCSILVARPSWKTTE